MDAVRRALADLPVPLQFVHDHLRPLHAYRILPVVDPTHQAPVDAYEIPDRHRRALALRGPADCFPFATALAGAGRGADALDVDHTEPYRALPSGPDRASRLGNDGLLGRFHHRVETFGRWTVRQPFGIYLWRDPHGRLYLVDHTGTRRVSTGVGPARTYDADLHDRTPVRF